MLRVPALHTKASPMAKRPRQTKDETPRVTGGKVTPTQHYDKTYYAGLFIGTMTPEEFYLSIGDQASPKTANMFWRFACSLNATKRLHAMLGLLLQHHEETWGTIPLTRTPLKPPKQPPCAKKGRSRKKRTKRARKKK